MPDSFVIDSGPNGSSPHAGEAETSAARANPAVSRRRTAERTWRTVSEDDRT